MIALKIFIANLGFKWSLWYEKRSFGEKTAINLRSKIFYFCFFYVMVRKNITNYAVSICLDKRQADGQTDLT